ncbi:MAG: protein-disulfide reductase DsbD domain-containing protein [Bryobacteraceae bacterium]
MLAPLTAQISTVLSVTPPEKIAGKRNETVTADFKLQLRGGYHVNSNTPNDEFLIPLRFTWTNGAAEAGEVIFPKPQQEKYEFSSKLVSVFSGEFKAQAKFKLISTGTMIGKLRYQACSDKACLPPRTIEVKLPVVVQN